MSATLRDKVAKAIDKMAGKKVVEVNLTVVGVRLREEEEKEKEEGLG